MNSKENAAQFIARLGLFDGQSKNPDILSIIIIANLVAANPDTKELTLSNAEVATLSLSSIPFIERLKEGIKKQDQERSNEWDKLDSDFIRMLFQYIVLQQDTEGNSYKAWISVCHEVRPSYRAYGKHPFFTNTIGSIRAVLDTRKLEKLRSERSTTGAKDYEDFMAVWLPFLATEYGKKRDKKNAEGRAEQSKRAREAEECTRLLQEFSQRMLDEPQGSKS